MTSLSSTGPTGGERGGAASWRARFDAARATMAAARPSAMIESQIGAVERSLQEADGDRQTLGHAIVGIDPDRVTAELKAALRSGAGNDRLIASLRRRHETVNDLLNRLEQLDRADLGTRDRGRLGDSSLECEIHGAQSPLPVSVGSDSSAPHSLHDPT